MDLSEFFDDEDGMAACAAWHRPDGQVEVATVLLDAPDAGVLDDRARSRDYMILYPATSLCEMDEGDTLIISAKTYRVRSIYAVDDGELMQAELTRTDG